VRRTAELFRFDPFAAISEGTLLVVAEPRDAERLSAALAEKGVPNAVCGEVVPAGDGLKILRGGRARTLEHPVSDPYWKLAAELSR
jgi:hydrogenase maturation factor